MNILYFLFPVKEIMDDVAQQRSMNKSHTTKVSIRKTLANRTIGYALKWLMILIIFSMASLLFPSTESTLGYILSISYLLLLLLIVSINVMMWWLCIALRKYK